MNHLVSYPAERRLLGSKSELSSQASSIWDDSRTVVGPIPKENEAIKKLRKNLC